MPATRSTTLASDASKASPDASASTLDTLPTSGAAPQPRRPAIKRRRQRADGSQEPPTYTIDLSQPPEARYAAMARDHRPQLLRLTALFDDVAAENPLGVSAATLKRAARLLLRRLHDAEQTAELRGISRAAGVEMWLLVAFNVLLDLFMGCTSGGARVRTAGEGGSKMVHFRTLDWGMDELRLVVVQLEFVERAGGPVIARSVTYVGFIGILTGVRYVLPRFTRMLTKDSQDLSLSLNFRAVLNNGTNYKSTLLYITHQLSVLLGFGPSIASRLRHLILPRRPKRRWEFFKSKDPPLPTYTTLLQQLPFVPTTSCYLTLSNGQETCVIDKDRVAGTRRTSRSFISVTNHDVSTEQTTRNTKREAAPDVTGMQEVLEESYERRDELERRYRKIRDAQKHLDGADVAIDLRDVERLVLRYPTSNECTHFAAIMDPAECDISWIRWWRKEKVYHDEARESSDV